MSAELPLVVFGLLMLALAIAVRWECVRHLRGPSIKLGDRDQLRSDRISYSPPPRAKHNADHVAGRTRVIVNDALFATFCYYLNLILTKDPMNAGKPA